MDYCLLCIGLNGHKGEWLILAPVLLSSLQGFSKGLQPSVYLSLRMIIGVSRVGFDLDSGHPYPPCHLIDDIILPDILRAAGSRGVHYQSINVIILTQLGNILYPGK